jgi:hypothetical protein
MTKTHLTKSGTIALLGARAFDSNVALCGARQGAGRQGLLFTTDAADSNLCARCANVKSPKVSATAEAKAQARAERLAREEARNLAEIARWRRIREEREAAEAAQA